MTYLMYHTHTRMTYMTRVWGQLYLSRGMHTYMCSICVLHVLPCRGTFNLPWYVSYVHVCHVCHMYCIVCHVAVV